METPIEIDDNWGYPHFRKPMIYILYIYIYISVCAYTVYVPRPEVMMKRSLFARKETLEVQHIRRCTGCPIFSHGIGWRKSLPRTSSLPLKWSVHFESTVFVTYFFDQNNGSPVKTASFANTRSFCVRACLAKRVRSYISISIYIYIYLLIYI